MKRGAPNLSEYYLIAYRIVPYRFPPKSLSALLLFLDALAWSRPMNRVILGEIWVFDFCFREIFD